MNRDTWMQAVMETVSIMKNGFYQLSVQKTVDISEDLEFSKKNTQLFLPDQLEEIDKQVLARTPIDRPVIEVSGEDTFQAAKRLIEYGAGKVLCLNFASAVNPGGGFIEGYRAQEESLCRDSGLYNCINGIDEYYKFHRKQNNRLFSHRMIYSPDVPVFRSSTGSLLEKPFKTSIITAAAVDHRNGYQNQDVQKRRIELLISLLAFLGYKNLVLGAWGCGVFRNNPLFIAESFKEAIDKRQGNFSKIVFAILDTSREGNLDIFKRVFELV